MYDQASFDEISRAASSQMQRRSRGNQLNQSYGKQVHFISAEQVPIYKPQTAEDSLTSKKVRREEYFSNGVSNDSAHKSREGSQKSMRSSFGRYMPMNKRYSLNN